MTDDGATAALGVELGKDHEHLRERVPDVPDGQEGRLFRANARGHGRAKVRDQDPRQDAVEGLQQRDRPPRRRNAHVWRARLGQGRDGAVVEAGQEA
eukprot:2083-Chlamydomonas_euryale.AAC.1